MSIPTDFFVAAQRDVASVARDGPAGRLPTVQTSGVDPVKLATLNGIATGRDYAIDGGFDQLSDEVVEVRSEGEEGPWIFRIPDELAEALRSASDDLLTAIAREWAATEEWELDGVPADDLAPLLRDLAALARRAEPPRRLYLWMSL